MEIKQFPTNLSVFTRTKNTALSACIYQRSRPRDQGLGLEAPQKQKKILVYLDKKVLVLALVLTEMSQSWFRTFQAVFASNYCLIFREQLTSYGV